MEMVDDKIGVYDRRGQRIGSHPLSRDDEERIVSGARDRRALIQAPSSADLDNWFLVSCVGRGDAHALRWLKDLGFECYYPMERYMRPIARNKLSKKQRKSGRAYMEAAERPLFPRYIFVRMELLKVDWQALRQIAGVGGMVYQSDNLPVHVPPREMAKLRGKEVDGAIPEKITLRELLGLGEEVRVRDGAFAGFNGLVEDLLDRPLTEVDSEARIKVALSIFGRATPVTLVARQVEKL